MLRGRERRSDVGTVRSKRRMLKRSRLLVQVQKPHDSNSRQSDEAPNQTKAFEEAKYRGGHIACAKKAENRDVHEVRATRLSRGRKGPIKRDV